MAEDNEATGAGWFSDEVATFGDRLCAAREAQGLSQIELAARLGVQLATLLKWEQDLIEPRANRIQMLAGMLGVSLAWLMTGEGNGLAAPTEPASIPPEMTAILDEMNVLQSELQRTEGRLGKIEKRLREALGLVA